MQQCSALPWLLPKQQVQAFAWLLPWIQHSVGAPASNSLSRPVLGGHLARQELRQRIQVESPISKRLFCGIDQAPTWRHCRSDHSFLREFFLGQLPLPSCLLACASFDIVLQLSNNQVHPGFHDEVDIEFLGTTPGRPYKLQTNVYVKGSGDGRVIGREMKFHLWFDPAADFHHYAILWNPNEIIFFVDDIPIRRYPRRSDDTFPLRPMWVYGTIWDASSWATDNGKHRVDYRHQPFVARFTRFVVRGCSAYAPSGCRPVPSSPSGFGLSKQQLAAMAWAQRNYMVYDYCRDDRRDRSLTPECWA
ncbi:xyloglucan endotransglucosylase/hydrolase protein 31 isoform X2 [Musa acuminata AAA Group]|uniref:xyloglucan endotransglucosylase/hydrolase protein 31 isoform X2 n=1 Tax=Musa acuminata AAA Group TaxID=214697 RepID=UPI0031D2C4AC